MNNELQIFNDTEFGALGVLIIGNKAYFPATECARILGYERPNNAIAAHCRCSLKQGVPHPQNPERTIEMNFIPEGDLYRLIVRSNLPMAEQFERWVFDEVLPSIRKHGLYSADELLANPDLWIRALEQIKAERARNAVLAAENEDLSVRINESERFWTIMKFSQHFNLCWDMKTCQHSGKAASSYSRQHGYEIRKCQTNDDRFKETNSYAYEVLETLFLPKRCGVSA
jgi:prophage antirepressor-like protein